jgi:hypothetical protein
MQFDVKTFYSLQFTVSVASGMKYLLFTYSVSFISHIVIVAINTHSHAESTLRVLCIIEEIPTEWKRNLSTTSPSTSFSPSSSSIHINVPGPTSDMNNSNDNGNSNSNGNNNGSSNSSNLTRLVPLRSVIIDILLSYAKAYSQCVERWALHRDDNNFSTSSGGQHTTSCTSFALSSTPSTPSTASTSSSYTPEVVQSDSRAVQRMLSSLRCLQSWTIAPVSSEEDEDDVDDIYPSGGLMPLKYFVQAHAQNATTATTSTGNNNATENISTGGSSSSDGISTGGGNNTFYRRGDGASTSTTANPDEFRSTAERDVEGSSYSTLLAILTISVRILYERESLLRRGNSDQSSSNSNGSSTTAEYHSGNQHGSVSGTMERDSWGAGSSSGSAVGTGASSASKGCPGPGAITEIITIILNILVELSSFPSLSDSKVAHYESHRQLHALRLCIALYHTFFALAGVWNVLLNGMIRWRQTLEDKWATAILGGNSVLGNAPGGNFSGQNAHHIVSSSIQGLQGMSTATHDAENVGILGNLLADIGGESENNIPIKSYLTNSRGSSHNHSSGSDDTNSHGNISGAVINICPASLLTALVDLTSAYVEKHSVSPNCFIFVI